MTTEQRSAFVVPVVPLIRPRYVFDPAGSVKTPERTTSRVLPGVSAELATTVGEPVPELLVPN